MDGAAVGRLPAVVVEQSRQHPPLGRGELGMPGKIPHAADQFVVPANEEERQSGPVVRAARSFQSRSSRSYRVPQRGAISSRARAASRRGS